MKTALDTLVCCRSYIANEPIIYLNRHHFVAVLVRVLMNYDLLNQRIEQDSVKLRYR